MPNWARDNACQAPTITLVSFGVCLVIKIGTGLLLQTVYPTIFPKSLGCIALTEGGDGNGMALLPCFSGKNDIV